MADKETVKKRLDVAVETLADIGPDIAEGWGGSILFKVTDLETGWMMKFADDGTVESLDEKVDEEAATSIVETDSDTLLGILNDKINAQEAYWAGSMRAHKSLEALTKIVPAMVESVDL